MCRISSLRQLYRRRERSSSMPRKIRSVEERFWSRVDKTSSPNGCWLWPGAKQKGYGCIQVGTHDNPKLKATHILAWELLRGPIPKGMEVMHNCPGGDNKACCNPEHCILGTRKQHADDTEAKGQYNHPVGIANGKSKLTPEKVVQAWQLKKLGYSCRQIAEIVGGVTGSAIYDLFRGRTWKHLIDRTSV